MNPSVDVSTEVNLVRPNKKLRGTRPHYEPGGGGLNVTRAIGKLGGESLAVYPAGGKVGDLLESLLKEHEIAPEPIRIQGMTRENLTASEQNTDQQFRFVMPGPELSESEWNEALARMEKLSPAPEYIVASGSLPPGVPIDFYGRVARMAKKIGARCIVDTSGEPLCAALEEGIFLLKPNRHELEQAAGEEIRDEEHEESLAREFISRGGCEVMALSLGSAGLLLVTGEKLQRFRSPNVTIRSRVGAGDSTVAGIVLALDRGKSYEDAVRFGIASGAAAVMTPGSELCRREDVEALYERLSQEGAGTQ